MVAEGLGVRPTRSGHDDTALLAASQCKVRAGTIVDVARRVVAQDRSQAKSLAAALVSLPPQGIQIGATVRSQLDLHPKR